MGERKKGKRYQAERGRRKLERSPRAWKLICGSTKTGAGEGEMSF